MIHRITNKDLLNLPPQIFEQKIREAVAESTPIIEAYFKSKNTLDFELPIKNLITNYFTQVYSVPFYTTEFVKTLLTEIKEIEKTVGYGANLKEDGLRRSPEISFNYKCPELAKSLLESMYPMVSPIFYSKFARTFQQGTVHVTRYDSSWTGNWHHDACNFSFVVPLNTGEYEGGGTKFLNQGTIDPLPTGHGLFYPSFSTLHKGLPITEGYRYLLVFWLV